MFKRLVTLTAAAVMLTVTLGLASADAQGREFGSLYHDGEVVRTFAVPAATPQGGIDPVYPIVDGVDGQLPVAGTAPGETDYHGGRWAVSVVTWNTDPYLLTSEAEVMAAAASGDVTITRAAHADFRCPVQP